MCFFSERHTDSFFLLSHIGIQLQTQNSLPHFPGAPRPSVLLVGLVDGTTQHFVLCVWRNIRTPSGLLNARPIVRANRLGTQYPPSFLTQSYFGQAFSGGSPSCRLCSYHIGAKHEVFTISSSSFCRCQLKAWVSSVNLLVMIWYLLYPFRG